MRHSPPSFDRHRGRWPAAPPQVATGGHGLLPASPALRPDLFKQGMRRLAAGVSIVTTIDGDGPHGFVATAVTSVSADPRPSLLVCANQASATRARIVSSGLFCVNILAEDAAATARAFMSDDRERRFAGCRWVPLATGAPALTDALVSFDCRLTSQMDVFSHTILIGEVEDVRLWRDDGPILYFDGGFARLADAG